MDGAVTDLISGVKETEQEEVPLELLEQVELQRRGRVVDVRTE